MVTAERTSAERTPKSGSSAPRIKAVLGALALLVSAVVVGVTAGSGPAAAVDGVLDPSFGTGGTVITTEGREGLAIVKQSDGKFVVAGDATNSSSGKIIRYNPDGTIDTSFGTAGVVTLGTGLNVQALAIQSDGRIVAAGTTRSGQDVTVTRLNTSGTPDTSCNTTGTSTHSLSDYGGASAVAIDPQDGAIVVAGFVRNGSEFDDFMVMRLTSACALDANFDSDGVVETRFQSQTEDRLFGVAVDPTTGSIVVVGYKRGGQFAMARYTKTGALDTSFGTAGKVELSTQDTGTAFGVTLRTDGKIVVVGSKFIRTTYTAPANDSSNCQKSEGKDCEGRQFWVGQFNSDGSIDSSFGTNGETTIPVNARGNDDTARGVAIHSDGKIAVSGIANVSTYSYNSSSGTPQGSTIYDFGVARLNPDGTLDTTFGTTGRVTTDFNTSADEAYGVVIEAGGKVVVAGTTGNKTFTLARYGTT
ncbi:MAG: putative delta-60 repeat protein, partial [Myxococcota bacterium]